MANLIVAAVRPDQTGVATGMNAVVRTIGGAVGGQVAATILASTLLASGFPAERGYTISFLVSVGVLAVGSWQRSRCRGGRRAGRRCSRPSRRCRSSSASARFQHLGQRLDEGTAVLVGRVRLHRGRTIVSLPIRSTGTSIRSRPRAPAAPRPAPVRRDRGGRTRTAAPAAPAPPPASRAAVDERSIVRSSRSRHAATTAGHSCSRWKASAAGTAR